MALCLFKHLRTVLVGVLLTDTCNGAMRAEPHTSRICRSVWQQSVALFKELRKQKLITNFSVCNNIITKNYVIMSSLSCKDGINSVEINEN